MCLQIFNISREYDYSLGRSEGLYSRMPYILIIACDRVTYCDRLEDASNLRNAKSVELAPCLLIMSVFIYERKRKSFKQSCN